MEYEVNVRRMDLFKMQLFLLPRLKQNYLFLVFLICCAGFGGASSVSKVGVLAWGMSSMFAALVIFFVLFLVGALIQVAFASAEKGFIGKTIYRINEKGFYEETQGTETMTLWKSIIRLYKFKSYLFVRINGFRIHMIPKREFSNAQEFELFCDEITRFKCDA